MSLAGTAEAAPEASLFDVRKRFFGLFLFLIMFAQGVRLGGIPVPSSMACCLFYLAVFNPRIPPRTGAVFLIAFCYILLASLRNALEPTGSLRDFFYIGLCVQSFLFTVCLYDAIEHSSRRAIQHALLVLISAEVALQCLEYFNPLGFNSAISPLLNYWDSIANSKYLTKQFFAERAAGSFGSPTVAGFISYLLIRGAAIYSGRRWAIYLALPVLIITGARGAAAFFLFWELGASLVVSPHRKIILFAIAAIVAATTLAVIFTPEVFEHVFIFNAFKGITSWDKLAASNSAFTRLAGIKWALEQSLSRWIFGGMTAFQFQAFEVNVFSFDSELILRSMQYGLLGYGCFVACSICTGYNRRDSDWWFSVFLVISGSLVNFISTNLIIFPFLILYNLLLKKSRTSPRPPA